MMTTHRFLSSVMTFALVACAMPFIACKKKKEKPEVPSLQLPVNEASSVSHFPTFSWGSVDDADEYQIQVSRSGSDFSSAAEMKDDASRSSTSYKNDNLYYENDGYYWRVRASNSEGESNWSEVRSFGVDNNSPDQPGPVFGQILVYDPSLPSGVTYNVVIPGFGSDNIGCSGGWPSDCDAPDSCSFARFNGVYEGSFNCIVTFASGPNSGQTAFSGYVDGSLGACNRVNVHDLN